MKKAFCIISAIVTVIVIMSSAKKFTFVQAEIASVSAPNTLSWGLIGENGIDIEKAWEIKHSAPNIKVGVIDTGICEHKI